MNFGYTVYTFIMSDSNDTAVDHGSTSTPVMQFTGNLAENWRRFKLRLQFFMDSKYSKNSLTNERKTGILLTALGDKGFDIYEGFRLLETDKPTYNDVLERFDGHFNPRRNTVYERFLFFQVK